MRSKIGFVDYSLRLGTIKTLFENYMRINMNIIR